MPDAVMGISYATLERWIHEKKLQTFQAAGGHHRIPEGEVDKYLHRTEERRVAEKRPIFVGLADAINL